jgi:hypothetical protein
MAEINDEIDYSNKIVDFVFSQIDIKNELLKIIIGMLAFFPPPLFFYLFYKINNIKIF